MLDAHLSPEAWAVPGLLHAAPEEVENERAPEGSAGGLGTGNTFPDRDESVEVSSDQPDSAPRSAGASSNADIRAEFVRGYTDAICAYAWHCKSMLSIVRCESGFDPLAVGAGSIGLTQIQVYWHVDKVSRVVGRQVQLAEATTLLLDPHINLEVAWLVYVAAGHSFSPWSCKP